ncbi:THAP domain-containing protein 1 B-like, partial [Aphis craccivora]
MPSCAICGRSRNKKTKEEHITFHRLPQSTVVQAQWLTFARENGIHESLLKPSISLFCSTHFTDSCFERYTNTTQLKLNAVPTIMIKRVKCAKILYPEIEIPIHANEPLCIQSSSSTLTC